LGIILINSRTKALIIERYHSQSTFMHRFTNKQFSLRNRVKSWWNAGCTHDGWTIHRYWPGWYVSV